jgi:hypothetical protein
VEDAAVATDQVEVVLVAAPDVDRRVRLRRCARRIAARVAVG